MPKTSPFSLAGKTALIAGASRGIGLAIAKEIAAAGAHTILAARSLDKLKAEVRALKKEGHSAAALELDVASEESIAACVKKLGPKVDILVNVSGTNVRKRVEDYTKEEYDRIMQTNLHGIVELTQAIGPQMVKRGKGGKIVMQQAGRYRGTGKPTLAIALRARQIGRDPIPRKALWPAAHVRRINRSNTWPHRPASQKHSYPPLPKESRPHMARLRPSRPLPGTARMLHKADFSEALSPVCELYQLRIVILHVADARADRPRGHAIGRKWPAERL